MFKRITLFLLINALIIFSVSALLHVFNVKPYLTRYGLDYTSLAYFCLIWGVAGSVISLMLSKTMAKWMMGVKTIEKTTASSSYRQVYDMVERLYLKANLPSMPEVGIFSSPLPNAFATGPTKKRALVAVSTTLLEKMSPNELEAILAHEITHIQNGDMVTMTLIQGIVNAFVMFLARIFAFIFSNVGGRSDRRQGSAMSYYLSVILFEVVFMLLGSTVVCYFSRKREFKADAGGARLSSTQNMISALRRLQEKSFQPSKEQRPKEAIAALMIHSRKRKALSLFSTHPPLEDRIKKLEELYH